MHQLPDFEHFNHNRATLVCHLLSLLYRLKQAAYDWYKLLCAVLTHLGFLYCEANYVIFIYNHIVISHTFALLIQSSGCQIQSDPIHRSVLDLSR